MEAFLLFTTIIFNVALIGFSIWAWKKAAVRSRILLDRWIIENGFTLVECRTRFFRRGPYRKASRGQRVLRVAVLDENDIERTGWVLCGSRFKGTLSNDVVGVLDEVNAASLT
jgi:hypothetical protein